MTDTPATDGADLRRASPLTAMRRVWRLSAGIMLLGLIAGLALGDSRPVSHQAEARVGVGSQSLGADAVAGYVLAAQQLAADYARYVTLEVGRGVIASKLGKMAASQVSSITASPIPNSTIIRIDVEASSQTTAVNAVGLIQQTLMTQINASVNATTPAAVLAHYNTVNTQLVTAQATLSDATGALNALRASGASSTAIAAQQAVVNAAQVTVNNLITQATGLQTQYQNLLSQPPNGNGLRSVSPPVSVGSNHRSLLERYGLVGLAVGALCALGAAMRIDRRALADAATDADADADAAQSAPTSMVPAGVRARVQQPEGRRRAFHLPPVRLLAVHLPGGRKAAVRTPARHRAPVASDTPRTSTADQSTPDPLARAGHSSATVPSREGMAPASPDLARRPAPPTTATPFLDTPARHVEHPTTDERYLAQALRAAREQEERSMALKEARTQETQRREVRDALQRRRREADGRLAAFLEQHPTLAAEPQFLNPDDGTATATEAAADPASAAANVQAPQPQATADEDAGSMAVVHPLFGDRPRKQIRVLSAVPSERQSKTAVAAVKPIASDQPEACDVPLRAMTGSDPYSPLVDESVDNGEVDSRTDELRGGFGSGR